MQTLKQTGKGVKALSSARSLKLLDESIAAVTAEDAVLSSWLKQYVHFHRRRLADDLMWLSQVAEAGTKVLECGSSPPLLTLALHRAGYSVCGLDIAPQRFSIDSELDHPVIKEVNFESEPLPFEDGSFDVVLFNEVFEHLRINPIETFREVHRVLKVGGRLFLSTPNLRSAIGLWNLFWHHTSVHAASDLHTEWEKITSYGHMGHVREYTAREVKLFLQACGFSVTQTIFRYYPQKPSFFKARLQRCMEGLICTVVPTLRPLFSVLCTKPPGAV